MSCRNLILSCVFVVLISEVQQAAAQTAIDGFFLSAYEDTEVKSINEQIQYLNSRPYRLAPIDQLQFRTESNQLDPSRQDYALRLNPANPWQVRNNNRYFSDYKSML